MFGTKNICSNRGVAASFVRLCTLFIAFAFLSVQALSFAHAHDHSDESPMNQTCEVCILAANDDRDADISAYQNSEAEFAASFWWQLDRLALPETQPAPSVEFVKRSIDPPPDPNQRLDSARAPPGHI
jgi:hypothetical protein